MLDSYKIHILGVVEDLVSNFLYYDRKGDEDLKVGEIEMAIKCGYLTLDDIVAKFKQTLEDKIDVNQ